MANFVLRMFLLLAFISMPCIAGSGRDDGITEIPFTFEKGYVIVQVKIKSKEVVDVIFATGAEHSSIDSGMILKFKLQAYYAGEGIIRGNSLDRTYTFAEVTDVRVGDINTPSFNMRFVSLAETSKRLGRQVFGIFGADFFHGRVVQFDFAKKVVRFLPQSIANEPVKQAESPGRIVLPMLFYTENLTLPVTEGVTFDGKKIKTLFDTGTVAVIALSSSATREVGLTPPPEKSTPRADKVKSLRFLDYEINDVPASLHPKGSDFDRDNKEFGAVIGSVLMQNFVVTFDFRKKLIVLVHN